LGSTGLRFLHRSPFYFAALSPVLAHRVDGDARRLVPLVASEADDVTPSCNYDLGYFDLEQKTLQPFDNPFGTRLSPMSWVQFVTYVSGPDKFGDGGDGGIRTLDRPLQAYNGL